MGHSIGDIGGLGSFNSMISTNYRQLDPAEVEQVAKDCADAWQDPEIPMRQYQRAVKGELEKFRRGEPVAPFDALVSCLRELPSEFWEIMPRLLDVGASGGYYSEVLRLQGFDVDYTGCDYSETFKQLAGQLYPGTRYELGNATDLPFADDSFDVVLHGAVLMHLRDWKKAISEAARVSNQFVIFHRTPVNPFTSQPTAFFEKEGYGCRMFEIHFSETELFDLFTENGLELIHVEDIFRAADLAHRTYLLRKVEAKEREWERA